jgi:hypothetical protein
MMSWSMKILVLLKEERRTGKAIRKGNSLETQKTNSNKLMTNTLALSFILISGCILLSSCALRRPEPGSISDEIGEVCFYQQLGLPWRAQVETAGCYSTRCTRQVQKVGSLILDQESHTMHFEASWVLAETSGFPFGCTDDCMGGGTVDFYFDDIEVGDWAVFIGDENIGKVMIPSGVMIERQCLSS